LFYKLFILTGKWKYRQHIRGKPHATGLKYFIIATSSNYVFSFWLYCGLESGRNTDTVSIVMDFVNQLESYPYWILADSYYGSLELAEKLHKKQVNFIIGCQKNRPAFLFGNGMHKEKGVKKGESRWCSNGYLAAFYFKDRAKVNFLTNADVIIEEKNELPKIVSIYRKHMGHVDKVDGILSNCMYSNRNRKWTDAHFKGCLKLCIDNCWIIYKALKNESISLEKFIMELACLIVTQYANESPQLEEKDLKTELSYVHAPIRSNETKYCEFCKPKKNHSKASYFCSACGYYLHIDCFAPFHQL